jgi:hypothetical protein
LCEGYGRTWGIGVCVVCIVGRSESLRPSFFFLAIDDLKMLTLRKYQADISLAIVWK